MIGQGLFINSNVVKMFVFNPTLSVFHFPQTYVKIYDKCMITFYFNLFNCCFLYNFYMFVFFFYESSL